MVEYGPADHVIRYLCPGCETIVPLDLEMDEVKTSSSSGHYRGISRRRKVLVVDDSTAVLAEAEDLLLEAGLHVLLASNGAEALRQVRDEHPDLIVIDPLMRDDDGFEVLRELRRDRRVMSTPVLATSRVYADTIVDFLREIGAQGFLDKRHIRSSLVFRVLSLLTPPPPAALA